MLKAGADPNAQAASGPKALIFAVRDNKAAIISMLPYKGTGTGMAKKKTAPALCPMPCGERTLRCACWQSAAPVGRR
ncbi:MAG: hypothetical protein ACQGQP_09730, partial [Desulfovibrio sp.]